MATILELKCHDLTGVALSPQKRSQSQGAFLYKHQNSRQFTGDSTGGNPAKVGQKDEETFAFIRNLLYTWKLNKHGVHVIE